MVVGLILAGGALLLLACGRRAPAPAPEPAREQPPAVTVVLLADPEGAVGEAEVSNASGSQTVARENEGVLVADSRSAPQPPRVWTSEEIANAFGEVLAAQPEAPLHFLLYFKSGTVLTDESQGRVAEILAAIRRRDAVDVSVIGHSDTSGDAAVNLRVSAQRARAVADQLLAAGVDPAILDVSSHGESDLLVATPDDVVEPRNRRVEVIVR